MCAHTHMCMGTKTINLMDDAYEMLKKAKKEDESFSDVVRRTFSKKRDSMSFFGVWGKEVGEEVEKAMNELKELDKKHSRNLGA